MCAGSLLANRELSLIYIRLLNSYRIETDEELDWHPVSGNAEPASLVTLPRRYKVRFVPRNHKALAKALEHTEPSEKNGVMRAHLYEAGGATGFAQ